MIEPLADLSDVAAAFEAAEIPARVEYVVTFATPDGDPVEYQADSEALAAVMAYALTRDARAAGIDGVDVTAVRRTWVLADEDEIPATRPADASRDADGYTVGPRPRWHPDPT